MEITTDVGTGLAVELIKEFGKKAIKIISNKSADIEITKKTMNSNCAIVGVCQTNNAKLIDKLKSIAIDFNGIDIAPLQTSGIFDSGESMLAREEFDSAVLKIRLELDKKKLAFAILSHPSSVLLEKQRLTFISKKSLTSKTYSFDIATNEYKSFIHDFALFLREDKLIFHESRLLSYEKSILKSNDCQLHLKDGIEKQYLADIHSCIAFSSFDFYDGARTNDTHAKVIRHLGLCVELLKGECGTFREEYAVEFLNYWFKTGLPLPIKYPLTKVMSFEYQVASLKEAISITNVYRHSLLHMLDDSHASEDNLVTKGLNALKRNASDVSGEKYIEMCLDAADMEDVLYNALILMFNN